MNENFDRLAIALAHNITRRHALQRFCQGVGISLLASLGFDNKAKASPKPRFICDCTLPDFGCSRYRQQGLYKQCIADCGACVQP